MLFKIIAAVDKNNGIGVLNGIPWSFKKDFRHFQESTKNKTTPKKRTAIIMGRKTMESLPKLYLPDRDNIVISLSENIESIQEKIRIRTNTKPNKPVENIYCFMDCLSAFIFCKTKNYETVWIIGGSQIYQYFINQPYINELSITQIQGEFVCDKYFPNIPKNFQLTNQRKFLDTDRMTNTEYELHINTYLKS